MASAEPVSGPLQTDLLGPLGEEPSCSPSLPRERGAAAAGTDAHLDSFNACTARVTSGTGCQIAQFERSSRRVPFCFCGSCITNT